MRCCRIYARTMDQQPPNTNDDHQRTSEFVPLLTANSRRVYTYILTLIPNRADAEDLFQEVSTTLWEKFDQYEPGTHFGAWACQIAYYKALKFRERQQRQPKLFSPEVLEAIDAETHAMDDSLDAEYHTLAECFAELRAEDREMIQQRYQPGGSPRKIAATTGYPIKRIYKRLDRIRKALRACITRKMAEAEEEGS